MTSGAAVSPSPLASPALDRPLAGRVALVTGASSGIGVAVAEALGGHGASIVAVARRSDRLRELGDRLATDGVEVTPVVADLLEPGAGERVVAEAVRARGRLDVVVNNAGVMLLGPVAETAPDEWEHMLRLNTIAPMRVSRAALPYLRESRGHLVQLSSIAGRAAMPGAAAYCASKFALNAFSDSLRQELVGTGVRVTLVEPGTVQTELRDHITHRASREAIAARAAAMRQLQPEDVAAAVAHAVLAPPHVAVAEVLLRPSEQA